MEQLLPLEPEGYSLAAWLVLKGLAVVYLCAFLSLGVQIRGLAGRDGIVPAGELLRKFKDQPWRRADADAAHGAVVAAEV